MDSDSEIEDLMSCIDPDVSDFFDSGDEYVPDADDVSSDDDDMPPRKRSRREPSTRGQTSPADSDDEDDVPLAVIRQNILRQRDEMAADIDEDLLTQLLDEPMWVRNVPFAPVDTTFIGDIEPTPDELMTPYQFFQKLVTDDMLENVTMQTNIYAVKKNGREIDSNKKEIEKFIGVYLRMGLMKAHCRRAYSTGQ